ncbi:nucleotidyltransferase domain-containing protein [bacterium]|nr:nucleotidyltransferase domain-containing protein [bacterium]
MPRIAALLEARDDIACAYLFGSRARGTATAASDWDIALLTTGATPEERAAIILAVRGELIALGSVDVADLDAAPPLLAARVMREGRVVFCRDTARRRAFELGVPRRYEEYLHLHRIQMQYLRQEYGNGT